MDKLWRSVIRDVSDVAGLASYSFGEEGLDRHTVVFKTVCVCVCVCVCVRAYVCVSVHACVRAYVSVRAWACVYVYDCAYTRMCVPIGFI